MSKKAGILMTALCCSLLLSSNMFAVYVQAGNIPESETESSETSEETQNITLTVSIFENISRNWILSPTQLSVSSDSGLSGLIERLVQYSYLDDAQIENGELIAVVDSLGQTFSSVGEDDEWIIILNGIELSVDDSFTLSDGDTLQLVFNSLTAMNNSTSSVSLPNSSYSNSTDELPWNSTYDSAVSTGCSWLKTNSDSVQTLMVLGAVGYSVDYKYLSRILQNIADQESPTGQELSEDVLCVSFSGISAKNFSGEDLIKKLSRYPDMGRLDTVYKLLAFDCNNYDSASKALGSRSAMINVIMAGQNTDGGIAETQGEESDIYLTALSLAALAPYQEDDSINTCIEKALNWLSEEQHYNSFYYDGSTPSCKNTSAVILALSSLSISLTDSRFCPSDENMLDALMEFYTEGSGFSENFGLSPSAESTEMALLALVSQKEHRNPLILRSQITGKGTIDFSSSEETSDVASEEEIDDTTSQQLQLKTAGIVGSFSAAAAAGICGIIFLIKKYKKHKKL